MKINIKVKEVTGRLLFLDEIQSKVNNLYSNAIYSGDAELPESENKRLIQDVASILYTFQQLNQRIAYLEEQMRWRPVSEIPTEGGYYEVKYWKFGRKYIDVASWNPHIIGFYNFDADSIIEWRPIPELEVKGE